jgi:SAM-dependent methyltransferase
VSEIARRFECEVIAIDLVRHHVVLSKHRLHQVDQVGRVRTMQGRIEAVPAPTANFDLIWCRDMLNHVRHLPAGLAECARVLKPGGKMLIYQTFATDLLEENEAARLYRSLVITPANMSPAYLEQTLQAVGLHISEHDIIGSEWREKWEEDGLRYTSHQLLRIARMRRDRDRLIGALGRPAYEVELADCHWGVYQLLGKLCPQVYIVEKG